MNLADAIFASIHEASILVKGWMTKKNKQDPSRLLSSLKEASREWRITLRLVANT